MKRILLILLLTGTANADVLGADTRVYLGSQVITNDRETFQVGITFEWSHVEVDMSHGIQRTKWRVASEPEWEMDEWQSGSIFAIRGYPFSFQKYRPVITWVHTSDITRGEPFNDEEEPTSDYVGVGVTAVTKRIEFDLTTGISGRECAFFTCGGNAKTHETQIQMRWYF